MIIQRLSQGIKNQDWFVVMAEILIVVIGIFIGLQVDDWNEDRKERELEQEYLYRIANDIQQHIDQITLRESYLNVVSNDLDTVLIYLAGSPLAEEINHSRVVTALYNSSSVYLFQPYSASYSELLNAGKMNIIEDIATRETIAEFFYTTDQISILTNLDPSNDYRSFVRSIIPANIQKAVLAKCELPNERTESILLGNCSIEMDPTIALQVLNKVRGKREIRNLATLNNSLIMNALYHYDINKTHSRATLKMLNEAIK